MDEKKPLDGFGVMALVAFAFLFAVNQIVIKVTNNGFQPVFLAALRSAIGIIALLIWVWARGVSIRLTKSQIWGGILAGVLFTAEFLCIFIALDITTVSRASVIFYTMPIWLGVIGHFVLPGERLSGIRALGFFLAIAGVAAALINRSSGQASWLGDGLALLAAILWAGIALTVRLTEIKTATAEAQLMCQLVLSAIGFAILAPLFGPFLREPEIVHVAGLFFQSVVVVLLGFLGWFQLLKRYPASSVASFSFLSPVLSVFLGWFILGDDVGVELVAALALVAMGLFLINRRPTGKDS